MKGRWKIPAIACVVVLIGGIIFCQFIYGKEKISAKEIKEQFSYEEGSMIPVYNLKQYQPLIFDLEMDYDYIDDFMVAREDLITVHTDVSCTDENQVDCYVWAKKREGKTRLIIVPLNPVLPTDSIYCGENGDYEGTYIVNGKECRYYWGCAPVYYICVRCDVSASDAAFLQRPEIIPFTVASESEVPNVTGMVDDNGGLTLKWDPVEGAEYYRIYHYSTVDTWSGKGGEIQSGAGNGYHDGVFVSIGETTETSFSDFEGVSIKRFREDEEDKMPKEEEAFSAPFLGKPLSSLWFQNSGVCGSFFVTAIVDGKESNLSAAIDTADLKLPYRLEDNNINFELYEKMEELPEKVPVINIDGSIMQRPVYYRLRKRTGVVSLYDFQVKGTLMGGTVLLYDEDPDSLPFVISPVSSGIYLNENSQLNKLPSMAVKSILRQEDSLEDAQDLYNLVKIQTEESVREGNEERLALPSFGLNVFADSAEEAWLAYGLLAGEGEISLKAFPNLQNPYILEDIFLKVCQQNPFILGVSSYYYDYDNVSLKVGYCYSRREMARRQKKIYQKASEVVGQIISEDMTDEQKERQIYLWLEKNCRYAGTEWERARERAFIKKERDSETEDCFNAYGVLIKKEAVCQGYAGAFQILGDMAGLTVGTANGYLNGNIPHAWNLIKLGDNWYQTDCSSNGETVGIPFYLYNSDLYHARLAGYYFLEDFLLDGEMDALEEKNKDSSKEYYNGNSFFAYDMDEIEDIVERQLGGGDIAFVYKGAEFDEQEFIQIVRRVFLRNGMDEKLLGLKYRNINGYIILYDINYVSIEN